MELVIAPFFYLCCFHWILEKLGLYTGFVALFLLQYCASKALIFATDITNKDIFRMCGLRQRVRERLEYLEQEFLVARFDGMVVLAILGFAMLSAPVLFLYFRRDEDNMARSTPRMPLGAIVTLKTLMWTTLSIHVFPHLQNPLAAIFHNIVTPVV